ncbi:unnamed protein product [Dimorphilus gyrociliatus]|uniref:Uncharacterized protein n=1 Tax=Dimorphilus gyrociliatus TaxID=2664684 RepID=A0A7I8WAP8_9ANNE|nr:unnamed protein product [Dimorphilus gyrociliatus]
MSASRVKFTLPENEKSKDDIDKIFNGLPPKVDSAKAVEKSCHSNDTIQAQPYTLHINPGLNNHLSEESWKTLTQAKCVYEDLLSHRCYRLDQRLLERKAYLDEKINDLYRKETKESEQEAMEYAVKCQYQLQMLQEAIVKDLTGMMKDYQGKLDLLTVSLLKATKGASETDL